MRRSWVEGCCAGGVVQATQAPAYACRAALGTAHLRAVNCTASVRQLGPTQTSLTHTVPHLWAKFLGVLAPHAAGQPRQNGRAAHGQRSAAPVGAGTAAGETECACTCAHQALQHGTIGLAYHASQQA